MSKARSFKHIKTLPKFPHKSSGWLEYRDNSCVLNIDPSITSFYRKLIPKHVGVKPQKYNPHITIIRSIEIPNSNFHDKPYHGYYFDFYYNGKIFQSGSYFFIPCDSKWFRMIRKELGLNSYRFEDTKQFHITIGNIK